MNIAWSDRPGWALVVGSRSSDEYRAEEIACDIDRCRGFRIEKYDGTAYDVLINTDVPRRSSCECLGFLRHGYCRHLDLANWFLKERVFPAQENGDEPENK